MHSTIGLRKGREPRYATGYIMDLLAGDRLVSEGSRSQRTGQLIMLGSTLKKDEE
jgi:hypothetical protein